MVSAAVCRRTALSLNLRLGLPLRTFTLACAPLARVYLSCARFSRRRTFTLTLARFYAYLRKCLHFCAWAYASNSAMMRAMAPSSQETVIRSATALTRSEALATA